MHVRGVVRLYVSGTLAEHPSFLSPLPRPLMEPASVFFPDAQDFTITGGSFNNVQGDQHNLNRTTVRLQIPNSKNTIDIDPDELASIIRGMGIATTTVNHVQGNQYNQVTQQEKIERTMFDDVSNQCSRGNSYS